MNENELYNYEYSDDIEDETHTQITAKESVSEKLKCPSRSALSEFIKEEDSGEESYTAYAARHGWAEDGNGGRHS